MKLTKHIKVMIGLFTVLLLPTVSVSAQDINSNSDTTFRPNISVIPPVDPDEGDDIVPIHPPTAGPLSINYASDIAFGKHNRQNANETFYAKEDTVTITKSGETRTYPNFVQVTDLRGTASGWLLSVRQNGPLVNGQGDILEGAEIIMTAHSIKSQDEMMQIPEELAKDQSLVADGSTFHPIVTAGSGTGIGTWNVFLGEKGKVTSSVSLHVPKETSKSSGIYSTSLTWSLQDAL